jgi:hypothetical protein
LINIKQCFGLVRSSIKVIGNDEKVSIGWCDSGSTDGRFTDGIVGALVSGPRNGVHISSSIRVEGNQIGRQRQVLFEYWSDTLKSDWLLWVDSDICVTVDILQKLWDVANKDTHPVITGVYFVSKELDGSLMVPYPVVFNNVEENPFQVEFIHPLPQNQVIKCDSAGMGLVLMHKSIIEKLKNKYPNESLFAEQVGVGDKFISEDVSFFRKLKKVGIPLHAHTGAIATHVKRFQLNADYYNLYWNSKA